VTICSSVLFVIFGACQIWIQTLLLFVVVVVVVVAAAAAAAALNCSS
jgi:hypothetical protein